MLALEALHERPTARIINVDHLDAAGAEEILFSRECLALADDESGDLVQEDGAGAHDARAERRRHGQAMPVAPAPGVAHAGRFAVGGGVAFLDTEVVAGGDNLPGGRPERGADRHAALTGGFFGLFDGGVQQAAIGVREHCLGVGHGRATVPERSAVEPPGRFSCGGDPLSQLANSHTATQSASSRFEELTALLQSVSSAKTPQEAAYIFGASSRRVFRSEGFLSVSRRGLPDGQYKITRRYVDGRLPLSPNESNPWRDWDRLETHTGGFVGEALARGGPQLITDLDLQDDPVLGDALGKFKTCAVIPIFDNGEPLNWVFEFRNAPDAISADEFETRMLVFNLHGRSTKNLVTAREVEALNAKLNLQLERVAAIQRALLPDATPHIPGARIATSYLTSDDAGGDYYDFLPLSGGRWGIFVGDVSGHGAGAATVVAMLHAILRTYPDKDYDPAGVLRYLNAHISEKRIEGNFVTAFFGVLDPATRELRFANAGHHPPRLKKGEYGPVGALDGCGTPPLGVLEQIDPTTNTVVLEPMDTVVLFTDGITEARRPEPDGEMFGLERLDAALEKCSGEPECVIDSIHTALFAHTNARTRDDDQAIVALRVE